MRLDRFDSLDPFLRAAGPFLRTREAEHCLILGIAANLRRRTADPAGPAEPPPYLATVRDGRRVVLAAFQTPPWQLVLSEVDDPAALGIVVKDRATVPDLPAVIGPAEHVGAFAEAWSAVTGVPHRLGIRERIFRLATVIPPRPIGGRVRPAGPPDRPILVDWLTAFVREALDETDFSSVDRQVDSWLDPDSGRSVYLWDDGRATSLCGVTGPTPTGIRIGPVYTPPERRGRGYASNLVAVVAQAELDDGRRACFLFTDRANPTSNHIYQAIGFEPVRDVDQYRFG